ncbi:Germinal-center associated nuclear protein [Trichoplax sp. H2]|nr:Germinal-center associated nuclear protein [Trichoplax sp. H2]|eukprot:RDD43695.1 Germinal-center associated nuclear protein [Trichoplax sp. H2]
MFRPDQNTGDESIPFATGATQNVKNRLRMGAKRGGTLRNPRSRGRIGRGSRNTARDRFSGAIPDDAVEMTDVSGGSKNIFSRLGNNKKNSQQISNKKAASFKIPTEAYNKPKQSNFVTMTQAPTTDFSSSNDVFPTLNKEPSQAFMQDTDPAIPVQFGNTATSGVGNSVFSRLGNNQITNSSQVVDQGFSSNNFKKDSTIQGKDEHYEQSQRVSSRGNRGAERGRIRGDRGRGGRSRGRGRGRVKVGPVVTALFSGRGRGQYPSNTARGSPLQRRNISRQRGTGRGTPSNINEEYLGYEQGNSNESDLVSTNESLDTDVTPNSTAGRKQFRKPFRNTGQLSLTWAKRGIGRIGALPSPTARVPQTLAQKQRLNSGQKVNPHKETKLNAAKFVGSYKVDHRFEYDANLQEKSATMGANFSTIDNNNLKVMQTDGRNFKDLASANNSSLSETGNFSGFPDFNRATSQDFKKSQDNVVNAFTDIVDKRMRASKQNDTPLVMAQPPNLTRVTKATAEGKLTAAALPFKDKIANDIGECYDILLEIDTNLRKERPPESVSEQEKKAFGTCREMCPEIEYYRRAKQDRFSIYESEPGRKHFVRAIAVKEYSGSAADKDEPMPYELRPVKTLSLTMDYIIVKVINGDQRDVGEWFDFVWNRTRAIRKDITIQRLCDLSSADLVEKCARFHALCGHLLCQESMHTFDMKINNENLVKCLQTLRHFYSDLHAEGLKPEGEAEFRCYDILIHVNEGDMLRQAQEYLPEVFNSDPVQFAISVAQAVTSNNYIKFFKLIKSAPYLCACLMHQHFTQMRIKGLQCMIRSYSMGKKAVAYPMKKFIRQLFFENDEEAFNFCHEHGLTVNDNDTELVIQLDRNSFTACDKRIIPHRSSAIEEKRRNLTIGEIVYGSSLPDVSVQVPSSSFGESLRFIGSYWNMEETKIISPVRESNRAIPRVSPVREAVPTHVPQISNFIPEIVPKKVKAPAFTNTEIEIVAKMIIETTVRGMVMETCRSTLNDVRKQRELALTEEKLNRQRIVQQERRKKEIIDVCASTTCNNLIDEVVNDAVQQSLIHLKTAMINNTRKEKLTQLINKISLDVHKTIMDDCISTVAAKYVDEEMKKEKQRIMKLNGFLRTKNIALLRNFFLSPQERIMEVQQIQRMKNESAINWTNLKGATLGVCEMIATRLANKLKNAPVVDTIWWKLVIVISAKDLCNVNIYKSLLSVYGIKENFRESENFTIKTCLISHVHRVINANLCYRIVFEDDITDSTLIGTNGILFLLNETDNVSLQSHWMKQRKRLEKLFKSLSNNYQIPMAICLMDFLKEISISDLKSYINTLTASCGANVLVCDSVFRLNQDSIDLNQIYNMNSWLADNSCFVPRLNRQNIMDAICEGFQIHFETPALQNYYERERLNSSQLEPEILIALYNAVVQYIAYTIGNEKLNELSYPASEFINSVYYRNDLPPINWNSIDRLEKIRNLVLSFKIPEIKPSFNLGNWENESIRYLEYFKLLDKNLGFTQRIENLLNRAGICHSHDPRFVPWTLGLDEYLQLRLGSLYSSAADDIGIYDLPPLNTVEVYYLIDEADSFVAPTEWIEVNNVYNSLALEPSFNADSETTEINYLDLEGTTNRSELNHFATKDRNDTDLWKSLSYLDSVLKNEEKETNRLGYLLEQQFADHSSEDQSKNLQVIVKEQLNPEIRLSNEIENFLDTTTKLQSLYNTDLRATKELLGAESSC